MDAEPCMWHPALAGVHGVVALQAHPESCFCNLTWLRRPGGGGHDERPAWQERACRGWLAWVCFERRCCFKAAGARSSSSVARLAQRIHVGPLGQERYQVFIAGDPGMPIGLVAGTTTGLTAGTAKRLGPGQGAQAGHRPWARPKSCGDAVAYYEMSESVQFCCLLLQVGCACWLQSVREWFRMVVLASWSVECAVCGGASNNVALKTWGGVCHNGRLDVPAVLAEGACCIMCCLPDVYL